MIEIYEKYADGLSCNEEIKNWIRTVLKNYLIKQSPLQIEIEHIIDYLNSDSAPKRLSRMSYKAALINTTKWNLSLQKKGAHIVEDKKDTKTILKFEDGSRMAKLLTKKALEREGFLMRHCVASYDPKKTEIYSYRDSYNNPHATIEIVRDKKEINQVKGKGNGSIHPRYIFAILEFLKSLGMTIRTNEMRNLGYHHVPNEYLSLIDLVDGASQKIKLIFGEHYVFEND